MKLKSLVFLMLAFGSVSFADIIMLDPNHLSCSVEKVDSYFRCNLLFDGMVIHEGRADDQVVANGDLVKCTTLVQDAIQLRKRLVLRRSDPYSFISWGQDFLLTLAP